MTLTAERPATPEAPATTHRSDRPNASRARLRELRRRARPRPRSTSHSAIAAAAAAFMVIFVWIVFYALVLTPFVHARSQDVLYAQFREQVALATAPLGGAITPGAPVGVMSMPGSGIDGEVIVEGTASEQLISGAGHRRDTVLPGQPGVSVIYGRSALFGGPFADIAEARRGDVITIVTGLGTAKYVVQGVRRAGDAFPAPVSASAGRLTLVTSEGAGWRAGWAPDHAVFVDASLASKPVGTLSGRPTAVPASETAMHGDTSALFVLVLLLPLLLFAVLATLWAHQRWGRRQAWIIGVPLILAGLWGASQTAVELLPNLL